MARVEGIPEEFKRPVAITIPRIPTKVCYARPLGARNCHDLRIEFCDQEKYQLLRQIGRGRYSQVFDSIEIATNKEVVIKKLLTEDETKIKRELIYLDILRKGPNIITSSHVIKMDVQGEKFTYGVVFEKIRNTDYRVLYRQFDDFQVRYYLYQLLRALEYAHLKGVMHRDVKPGNIVIDHPNKTLRLIDWGFGALYLPGQPYYCGACTLPYRAPELLLGYRQYHYAMDMWSFGCVAAGMIFRKDVFFESTDERTQLQLIGRLLGRQKLDEYLRKYNIRSSTEHYIDESCVGMSLENFLRPENRETATCTAIGFLKEILVYDHQERLTATEAKKHSYFLILKQGHLHYKKPDSCALGGPAQAAAFAGAIPPSPPSQSEEEVQTEPEAEGSFEMDVTGEDEENEEEPLGVIDELPYVDPNFTDVLMDDLMQAGAAGENRRSSPNEPGPSHREEGSPNMEYDAAEDSFFDGEDNTFDYMESADEDEDNECGASGECDFNAVGIEVAEEVQIECEESGEFDEDPPENENEDDDEDLPRNEDDDESLPRNEDDDEEPPRNEDDDEDLPRNENDDEEPPRNEDDDEDLPRNEDDDEEL